MQTFRIVLRGDHGGDLDVQAIEVRDNQADSPAFKRGIQALIDRCTLSAGDSITIETVD